MIGTPPSAVGANRARMFPHPAGSSRRRAVLGDLGAETAERGPHDLGDGSLLARGRGDLTEARHQPGHRRQHGRIGLAHPPSGAGSRSWLRPRARASAAGGADELPEERLRPGGPALELGVELRRAEPGVVGQLDDLDQATVGRPAAEDEARLLELLAHRGLTS